MPEDFKVVAVVKFNDDEALVLNRPIQFIYHEVGKSLVGEDGPFRDFLGYEKSCGSMKAFGGHEFTLKMVDGTTRKVKDHWWRALEAYPWIEEFCRKFPGDILYGEVFGNVQSLKYGAGPRDVFFRAFDVLHNGDWREYDDWTSYLSEEQRVPVVFSGPFDFDMLVKLSDGPSLITGANHIREGIVVRPIPERTHEHLGRVHLKLVGNSYLEKS